jgi:peptidyl-tRNA hydrolase, PTH1 family
MRIIVGLGNPGERYRRTRHNIGFMIVDALAAKLGVDAGRLTGLSWVAETHIGDEKVLLAKPQTFMNRSGDAVGEILALAGGAPLDLAVLLDDIALELGTVRVREHGGHGGHNGLRSVIDVLGTEEFARIRVGIRKGDVGDDLAAYVLAEFPPDDILVVQEAVGRAGDAVECLVSEGAGAAMGRYNRALLAE